MGSMKSSAAGLAPLCHIPIPQGNCFSQTKLQSFEGAAAGCNQSGRHWDELTDRPYLPLELCHLDLLGLFQTNTLRSCRFLWENFAKLRVSRL